ncbi:amidohydrolase [Intestinimonas butyriciproducens]|uniref:amidohydrolase n=1 Tax=Intestinimonas butyriciproducens TaxID=1297617 RepID=UPI00195A750B|nr:amidohydrolase [Intestinimonas butyriciproducens]MBM6917618.1 amidohydrolase [Intestinimonas butyriciproducens]
MISTERANQLKEIVASQREVMFSAADYIWKHPETGYREWKTHAYLAEEFKKLGYELVEAGNIPGFYTDIDTGKPGPKLLIMGELDSLIVSTHPDCDPETGYVHACGHHCQVSALLGIAAALKQPGAMDNMSGSIRLMAVPAEELIEIGFREELRKQGVIKYFGGKVEFMHRGYMDGCDIALLVHTGVGDHPSIALTPGNNGCVTKNINFIGVSAHAGGAPHLGVNALYAASQAMNAANALRETFQEKDTIRFHPIITKGGGAVNAIPNDVRMESYVRGASLEAIKEANTKINRALAASAASMGANVVLKDRPGYTPLENDEQLYDLTCEIVKQCFGEDALVKRGRSTGCTDVGDVSAVMPTVQPYASGACGVAHGSDYRIADPESALVMSAQYQVLMAEALLSNNAELGKKIIQNAKLRFSSMEEFFHAIDELFLDKEAVKQNEDGTITLDYQN